ILGTAIYNWAKSFGGSWWGAFSLAFLVVYGLVAWAAPALIDWMYQVGWVSTLLSILFILAIIGLIKGIIDLFGSIKSGSWSLNRTAAESDRAERQYNDKENKSSIALNREKKAAENMFKMETELNNLNRNIAQLSSIEANLYNRDLTNRQEQVKTLAELENALNGSFRLQAQVQQAYANASRPEYANNQQYLDSIKSAAQQLDDFVGKINNLLLKLHDGIKRTQEDTEKEIDVDSKLEAYLKDLEKGMTDYLNATAAINEQIVKLGSGKSKNLSKETLNSIKDTVQKRRELFAKIQEQQGKIKAVREKIKKNDEDNLKDLQHAITVSQTNPSKDMGVLQRGFNAAMNYSSRPEGTEPAIKNKSLKGAVSTIYDLLNIGYKYMSADSLREILQSVNNVHARLQETVSRLIVEEKNYIVEKNSQIKQCNDLHIKDRAEVIDNINKEIDEIKKEINISVNLLQVFGQHLQSWMQYMIDNKGKKWKEKEPIYTNLPPVNSKNPAINSRIKELKEYANIFQSLQSNFTVKEFLITKRNLAEELITAYNKNEPLNKNFSDINFGEGDRTDYNNKIIEDFKKLIDSIKSKEQDETAKAQSVDQLLRIEREMASKFMSNNNNSSTQTRPIGTP
ncbi:MAG TPA: hypothetical protein VEC16_06120, partial [Alphaproteobacteria bacterium]|nr:hypothetical protein [Alphaproteobacteria bacterium]